MTLAYGPTWTIHTAVLMSVWLCCCVSSSEAAAAVCDAGRTALKELAAEVAGRAASSLALTERGAPGLAAALGADLPSFTTLPKPAAVPGAAPGDASTSALQEGL